jgi:hypothetical protein
MARPLGELSWAAVSIGREKSLPIVAARRGPARRARSFSRATMTSPVPQHKSRI